MAAQQLGIRRREGSEAVEMHKDRLKGAATGDRRELEEAGFTEEHLDHYLAQAETILDKFWFFVEKLSAEILQHRTLYHEEALYILCAENEENPWWLECVEVYRKHRNLRSFVDEEFLLYLKHQPNLENFETISEHRIREGWLYPPRDEDEDEDDADGDRT